MTAANSCLRLATVLLVAVCLIISTERGHAYPAEETLMEDSEPLAYPLTNGIKLQEESSPHLNQAEKPKSCFHFYVSRNMSSLLSDATKMLQQVRDRREREWILTFIYRIKSLAEHLRTHPESRNYDCLPSDDEIRRKSSMLNDHFRIPQPELYFVDDMLPNHNQKRTNSASDTDKQEIQSAEMDPQKTEDNQGPHQSSTGALRDTSNLQPEDEAAYYKSMAEQSPPLIGETETHKGEETQSKSIDSIPTAAAGAQPELNPPENSPPESIPTNQGNEEDQSSEQPQSPDRRQYDNVIVISSAPDCESNLKCEEALNRHIASQKERSTSATQEDDLLVQQLHEKNEEEDRIQQGVLKQRIRKALLEEMAPEVKKLRTVGGSEKDLLNLWKQSENESSGKSSESYQDGDFDYEEIGAAAGDLNSDGYTTNDHTVAPSLGEIKNFKRQSNSGRGTKAYEPYDDSDVLVKQLFDIRFESTKTTKSLKDKKKEEYLITSTPFPY